jgi:uncharacterized protein YfeS
MNIYKYQIIKFLLTQNKDAKQLKKLNKDQLLKEIENIDKKQLSMYLNKRKQRTFNKDIVSSTEIHKPKIIIQWDSPFIWI